MAKTKGYRVAIVGTASLRGQEIKRVLAESDFPLAGLEMYDSDIEEDFSRLSEFRDEPKVIRSLSEESLGGQDIVFFAADKEINRKFAPLAEKLNFQAVDLSETFTDRADIPLVVAGVNDGLLEKKRYPVIANPHPVTIILSHLFHLLLPRFGLAKVIAFVLQPASAFDESGIEELANQSVSLLSGTSYEKRVFKQQLAFNLLSHTEKLDGSGFSSDERRVVHELRRVLDTPGLPVSLSVVQASHFHTYAVMSYLELERDTDLAGLEAVFRESPFLKRTASDDFCSVSCISVTGKDEIFIGQIKKEEAFPRGFWVWSLADNLTRGSALNALEVVRSLFGSVAA